MKILIDGKPVWVNYHHLYCFHVIVSEGSLAKAAQTLGIGSSALSIQMKQLEESLGFSLFERSHRKLQPNERGRVVLSYAQEIFRLGSEMVEALHDRPKATHIHLKVGVLDAIPKHVTASLVSQALQPPTDLPFLGQVKASMANFRRSATVSVSVIEGPARDLTSGLITHQLDLLLMNFVPPSQPGQLFSRLIARLPLFVFGSKQFIPFRRGFPMSLEAVPFVVPTADSRVRMEFESYCKSRQLMPNCWVEAQDAMLQKLLALQGKGLIVKPEFAVKEFLKRKELFKIGELDGVYEEWYILSAARKIENPIAANLMKDFKIF